LPVIDKVRKQEADMHDCARRLAAASAATRRRHSYNIGRPRGFGPRGNALSSAAISFSLKVSFPAAALSAA
jgi:hypothetical protein